MTFSSKLCVMLQGRIQYIPQMSHMPLTYDGADVLLSPNGPQRTRHTHTLTHTHTHTERERARERETHTQRDLSCTNS